jgi:hypothetical protein
MFLLPDIGDRVDELRDQLRRAQVVTADLMLKVVAVACTRINAPSAATKAAKIDRLIELEAWTEAALALVELEFPQWKLRRLVYDEGAWLCSLSKQWNLPDWLADSVEAQHPSLPLAILCALIEARQCGEPKSRWAAGSVPRCRMEASSPVEIVCCDNFA